MTTLDKANWLYMNGYFSKMIFTLSDNEIEALYNQIAGKCPTCGD